MAKPTSVDQTERLIVENANALARSFYKSMGYEVPEGYRFDQARHPQERMCWQMSCYAFEMIEGTDPNDALSSLEE